ncbi:MAG TPA: glycosyltransferase family 39 protein [Ktedonobacterales bacterium]
MNMTSAIDFLFAPNRYQNMRALARASIRQHGVTLGAPLIAGSILRLLWLGDTSFLGDQAELLALGRSAFDHHALIVTGILSSIGTLNPPVSTWVYAPFALVDPIAAAALTAILNIIAIALLYALATRYGGRRAGFVAASLYATASGAVHYSRFIWQQNLMAPFLLLLLGAVLVGLVEGRSGWLGWAALFWGIAVQLHPTAAALLGVLALAIALARRTIRRRDLGLAAAFLALLFGPLALWELASRGADLAKYLSLGSRRPVVDNVALMYLQQIISPAAPLAYGAGSTYVASGLALTPLGWVAQGLGLMAVLWLLRTLTPYRATELARTALKARLASPQWRLAATLFLWLALPVILLIRHTAKVQEHYLLVLLPVAYLAIGLWVATASRALPKYVAPRWSRMPLAGLFFLTLAVALSQSVGVLSELKTVHSDVYNGVATQTHGGIPLSSEQTALEYAQREAARNHATLAIASTAVQQEPFGYLVATDDSSATVYISDGCLVTPSSSSASPMVTMALPGTLAARVLPVLTGAREVGLIPVQGSAPLVLYRTAPGVVPQGEVAAQAADTSSPGLLGYGMTADSAGQRYLTVRWSRPPDLTPPPVSRASYWYGATTHGATVATYQISAQPLDSTGRPVGSPITANCGRLAWSPNADLLSWLPLSAADTRVTAWSVTISASPLTVSRPQLGPLSLETGAVMFGPARPLAGPVQFRTPAA